MDNMQCPQCGGMMKPAGGDMMKCEGCGHTMNKDDMPSGDMKPGM